MLPKITVTLGKLTIGVDRWGVDERGYFFYENDVMDDGEMIGTDIVIAPLSNLEQKVKVFIPVERMAKPKKEEQNG